MPLMLNAILNFPIELIFASGSITCLAVISLRLSVTSLPDCVYFNELLEVVHGGFS